LGSNRPILLRILNARTELVFLLYSSSDMSCLSTRSRFSNWLMVLLGAPSTTKTVM